MLSHPRTWLPEEYKEFKKAEKTLGKNDLSEKQLWYWFKLYLFIKAYCITFVLPDKPFTDKFR